MGRLKITTVTMAMMLMVATVFAGILHASRSAMEEAVEPKTAVYANLVTCGVGVFAEGILVVGGIKRSASMVALWVMTAPVRAIIHVAVGVFLLTLPELTFPSIVLAIYLFTLSAFLLGCTVRAYTYCSFLRTGGAEVDDNPSRAEALAAAKRQRRWLGFQALAAYPTAFIAAHAASGVAPAHSAHAHGPSPHSKHAPTQLRSVSRNPSPGSNTPPLPERMFGFGSTTEETSIASNSTSDTISTFETSSSPSPTTASTSGTDAESHQSPSRAAFDAYSDMASIDAIRNSRMIIPDVHNQKIHNPHQQKPPQGKSSQKSSCPENHRPSLPGLKSTGTLHKKAPRSLLEPSTPKTTPHAEPPVARTRRKQPAPDPGISGRRRGGTRDVASISTRSRRLGGRVAGGGESSSGIVGDNNELNANSRARHRPDLLAATVAATLVDESVVATKSSFQ